MLIQLPTDPAHPHHTIPQRTVVIHEVHECVHARRAWERFRPRQLRNVSIVQCKPHLAACPCRRLPLPPPPAPAARAGSARRPSAQPQCTRAPPPTADSAMARPIAAPILQRAAPLPLHPGAPPLHAAPRLATATASECSARPAPELRGTLRAPLSGQTPDSDHPLCANARTRRPGLPPCTSAALEHTRIHLLARQAQARAQRPLPHQQRSPHPAPTVAR